MELLVRFDCVHGRRTDAVGHDVRPCFFRSSAADPHYTTVNPALTAFLFYSMDTARPRATPVRSPTQMSRSASSRSVRAGASKPAGYDNPLFTSGDVLGDREPDAADVMPLVVGDHAVLTPRRPESPLVAKLKAQASEKGYKLRQDRILVRLGCWCMFIRQCLFSCIASPPPCRRTLHLNFLKRHLSSA